MTDQSVGHLRLAQDLGISNYTTFILKPFGEKLRKIVKKEWCYVSKVLVLIAITVCEEVAVVVTITFLGEVAVAITLFKK